MTISCLSDMNSEMGVQVNYKTRLGSWMFCNFLDNNLLTL